MHWEDKGYLLSKIKYSENAVISEIFTENHGKISGIIYGASSKKIKNYIFWELEFYKLIGYDLALKNIISEDNKNNEKIYFVESKNTKKIVPNFLVDLNTSPKNNEDLLSGLQLVSDYLDKSILRPNNINYPRLRTEFINLLK